MGKQGSCSLVCISGVSKLIPKLQNLVLPISSLHELYNRQPHQIFISCHQNLRLCIWLVLQGRVSEMLGVLAPICSSYSAVNRSTSKRSILLPFGDESLTGVRRGNKILSRCGVAKWFHAFPFSTMLFRKIQFKNGSE